MIQVFIVHRLLFVCFGLKVPWTPAEQWKRSCGSQNSITTWIWMPGAGALSFSHDMQPRSANTGNYYQWLSVTHLIAFTLNYCNHPVRTDAPYSLCSHGHDGPHGVEALAHAFPHLFFTSNTFEDPTAPYSSYTWSYSLPVSSCQQRCQWPRDFLSFCIFLLCLVTCEGVGLGWGGGIITTHPRATLLDLLLHLEHAFDAGAVVWVRFGQTRDAGICALFGWMSLFQCGECLWAQI